MSDPLAQYEIEMGTVCDMPECTRQATHILTCHQIDHCKSKGSHPSGTKSFMFCPEHAKNVGDNIADRVDAMKDAVAEQNLTNAKRGLPAEHLECNQCHMQINALSDVLNVEHLYPMASEGA